MSNIKNRLWLYDEVTWGTTPGSPTLIFLPHESYDAQLRAERRNSNTYAGLRQRKHGRTFRGTVSGGLTGPLYGWRPAGTVSLAQYLLDWGFANSAGTIHEALDLPSKGAEYAEGITAHKRHSGLRVNSTTLTGDGDAGTIRYAIDLIGKDEVVLASPAATPTNMYELTEFEFVDATYELDTGAGYAPIKLSSWQINVANNLRGDYVGGYRLQKLAALARVSNLTVNFPKEDDVWDALRRTITNGGAEPTYKWKITLKGLHKGTGTALTNWVQAVITMPAAKYQMHEDQRGRDDFPRLPLGFDLMKPDTAENDINIAWSDIA